MRIRPFLAGAIVTATIGGGVAFAANAADYPRSAPDGAPTNHQRLCALEEANGQDVAWCTPTAPPPTTTVPPSTTVPPTTSPPTTQAPPTTPPPTTAPPSTQPPTTTIPGGAMHMSCPGIPDVRPYAALEPARPMLCDMMNPGVATATQGTNSWLDDFDHGLTMASFPEQSPYVRFEDNSLTAGGKTGSFLHNNHWMVDVWAPNQGLGGSMLRPDRSFRFVNGKLVVETDVAAGIEEYGGFAWPEITVTGSSSPFGSPAYGPTPGKSTGDSLYAYGHFGGYDTIGIRLHERRPIMAYYDATQRGFPCGRVWELSWFQNGDGQCGLGQRAEQTGGGEWVGGWRSCGLVDPDTQCRDRFRWELTRDQITLFVNGTQYMQHTAVAGQHLVPDSLLNGDVYVYFDDQVYQPPTDRVVRFHWDRIAVNP